MRALRIVGVLLIIAGLITAGYGFTYKARADHEEKIWNEFVSGEHYNLKPVVFNISENKTVAGFFVLYRVQEPAYWYSNFTPDFGEIGNMRPPTRTKQLQNVGDFVRKTRIYKLIYNPDASDMFMSYYVDKKPDLVEISYNTPFDTDPYGFCNGRNKEVTIVNTYGHTYFIFPEDHIGHLPSPYDSAGEKAEYTNRPFLIFYDGGLVAGYLKDPEDFDFYVKETGAPIIVGHGFELPKGLRFHEWGEDGEVVDYIEMRLPKNIEKEIVKVIDERLCDPSFDWAYDRNPMILYRMMMFFYVIKPNTKPLRTKAEELWGLGGVLTIVGVALVLVGGKKGGKEPIEKLVRGVSRETMEQRKGNNRTKNEN